MAILKLNYTTNLIIVLVDFLSYCHKMDMCRKVVINNIFLNHVYSVTCLTKLVFFGTHYFY